MALCFYKANAALLSGWFQGVLGVMILIDVFRRIMMGSEPQAGFIVAISIIALIANIICLRLIEKHKNGDVHMRASWIFSKNDVIANVGVLVSGLLVWLLGSRWPDLIIGSLIALVILKGARHIIADARHEIDAIK